MSKKVYPDVVVLETGGRRYHAVTDLLRRGGVGYPLLRIADAHLKTYEARRSREEAAAASH